MKLTEIFARKKPRVVVIVQCRLSSTRLPRKALLPLGGKCVLEWTLAAMKKVHADKYFLAVDEESAAELSGIAKKCGWDLFAGSQSDVLGRFCRLIENCKADYVVRATADNPFLFWENANELVEEFIRRNESSSVDYMTYSGLPHGSGVEMFKASSLLKAEKLTDDPYDHEHVGPALYNHKDVFNSVFIKAHKKYYHPELRTTIDTPADYRRALALVHFISAEDPALTEPYTTEQIVLGMNEPSVKNPVLLVPSVQKGHGTGHLRRCLEIAVKCSADIFIPLDATLEQCASLVATARSKGLCDYQIVRDLSSASQYSIAVLDMFRTDSEFYTELSSKCPVVCLDEGTTVTDWADYLLDILPSVDLNREANLVEPNFIELPKHTRPSDTSSAIHTALVVLGGEDPASLSLPASRSLAQCGVYTSVIVSDASLEKAFYELPEEESKYIKILSPVENLKEKLCTWDLIVTHYGFTAFEASKAGCAVILLGTSPLHEKLALTYGFSCIASSQVNAASFKELLESPEKLFKVSDNKSEEKELSAFITELSQGRYLTCPVCRKNPAEAMKEKDMLVERASKCTFRRCPECGLLYQSFVLPAPKESYTRAYFFEDYKNQYGKTYLEDFASIKAQGVRRTSIIDLIYHHSHSSVTPALLDVGCAMGPFLDAANDAGWQVFGTDISADAVDYVQHTLNFPAVCTSFPETDVTSEFGIEKFDAVTMWYVIEHFENLDAVLKEVNRILKKGGVFAFSTPSASGVSGKYNTKSFFRNSPQDHFSIWEPEKTDIILRKYGFKVVRIVSTGIHPERFPIAQKHGWKPKSLPMKILSAVSHVFKLGDTFEVYARKIK